MNGKWSYIGHTLSGQVTESSGGTRWVTEGEEDQATAVSGRDTERIVQSQGYSWTPMQRLARDRNDWKSIVNDLCSEMK